MSRLHLQGLMVGSLVLMLWSYDQARGSGSACAAGGTFAYCPETRDLFIERDGVVSSVDLDRRVNKWQVDLGSSERVTDIVASDHVIAFGVEGPRGASIEAFVRATGRRAWSVAVNKTRDLTVSTNFIVVQTADRDGLMAIDGRDGSTVWRHSETGPPRYAKLLATSDGTILTDGFGLDVASGQIVKRWPLRNTTSATFAGDLRVVGAADGRLLAFRSDWTPAWEIRVRRPPADASGPASRGNDAWMGLLVGGPKVIVTLTWIPMRTTTAHLSAYSETGSSLWTQSIASLNMLQPGPMAICGDLVVWISTAEESGLATVHAFDARSGIRRWISRTEPQSLAGGDLACAGGEAYVSGGRSIFGVDLARGRLRDVWQY
jgi:outer membrane protein assembly factor BamB